MGLRGPKPSLGDAKKRLGDLSIYKGQTPDGIKVVQWDCIPICSGERCNIFPTCPHNKEGKCGVQKEYLDYVYIHYVGSVNPSDKMALFKIGMELIPIYSHLITLKIANHGRGATYYDNKGNIRVNPLFREIRETIRTISTILSDIAESFSFNGGEGIEKEDLRSGDESYYDSLFVGEGVKVERKRRNRV